MPTNNETTATQNDWHELYYLTTTKDFEGEFRLRYKIVTDTFHFETDAYRFRQLGTKEAFRLQFILRLKQGQNQKYEWKSSDTLIPEPSWQAYNEKGTFHLGNFTDVKLLTESIFFLNPDPDPIATAEKNISYNPPVPGPLP
jgi:hypothetical protein